MTTFLDRPRVTADNYLPDDTLDTLPLPVIDIADGYGTGLKLTEVIETLANEAEEIGVTYESDGSLQIGDATGDHIVIEQDVVDTEGSEPFRVVNTVVIVAVPTKNVLFRFKSKVQGNGELVEFQVDEETPGISSQHAEFSGGNGSKLPPDAVSPTLHFAQTMIEVADDLYKQNQISGDAHGEVVKHLADPEVTQHDRSARVMGSTALGRLLTNLGFNRAA